MDWKEEKNYILGVGSKSVHGFFGDGTHAVRRRPWTRPHMPRISQELLDCVFYVYPSHDQATRGDGTGGCGFFVSLSSNRVEKFFYTFAVTNKHVAAGNYFIRVNAKAGGMGVCEVIDWEVSGDHDIAIVPVKWDFDALRVKSVPSDMFLPRDGASTGDIVIGDDVFMVGRFIHVDGRQSNIPSARFGNVSMMEAEVSHELYGKQQSIIVEMRSVCGYSGSPVFCMPSMFDTRDASINIRQKYWLLGIHWGHITEPAELREKIVGSATAALRPGEREVKYISANTGMNGVVAGWHILDLIEDKFGSIMRQSDENELRRRGLEASGTQADST